MKKNLLTTFSLLFLIQYAFNQVPIAVADTAVTINQVSVSVNVLLNDYHPNGDTIEIYDLNDPMHGINWYVDSIVHYKSDYFIGWDKMSYNVAPVGNPGLQSDYTRLHIQVLENPDVPVARNDTFFAKYLEPTLLDILPNDDDPNGDSIKIDSIRYTSQCSVEISEDSSHVIFTSTHSPYGRSLFIYRVIETNTAENYHSDWARVRVHLEKNNDLPVPVGDVFEATGGIMASLDVMVNDHNPLNEELEILEVTDPTIGSVSIEGSIIKYTAPLSYAGPDDFDQEWLSLVLGIKVVKDVEEAIEHIHAHSTEHSESILTNNWQNATRFVDAINSSAVFVNASTRFNDGGQFGLGAEVAVSTQKLHARGPMGLEELTTYKWVCYGDGHVRP